MTENWLLAHPERWPLALIALALGLWVTRRSYPAGGMGRWAGRLKLGFGCRLMLYGLFALILLDPVSQAEKPIPQANQVSVAYANSMRWGREVEEGGMTIEKRVQAAAGDGVGWLGAVDAVFQVRHYELGERLRVVAGAGELEGGHARVATVGQLRTLANAAASPHLAAVVLFTDGFSADVDQLAELMAQDDLVPVFPVLVGGAEVVRDLSLLRVQVTQTPFEDTPITLTLEMRALGLDQQPWTGVVLNEKGEVLGQANGRVGGEDARINQRVRIAALAPGVHFLRVRVASGEAGVAELAAEGWGEKAGDGWVLNNERLVAVDRGSGPYRLLYLAGRPNWEYKFLRRALAADAEMQLPSLIRIADKEPKFEWRGRAGETSNPLFRGFGNQSEDEIQRYDQAVLIRLQTRDAEELATGFPKVAEELMGAYQAIIIDDLEAAFFSAEQMRLIERFVSERGGSLLLLGGLECFTEGGYQHSLIGQMSPVYLGGGLRGGPVEGGRLALTREGWLEPALRLRASDDEERQRAALRSGFYAANSTSGIKPGASVLASLEGEGGVQPALVSHRYGAGRVTALLVADLWRWGMKDEEERADFETFWRQLMRWSIADVPGRVELGHAVEGRLRDGGLRQLSLRVRDAAFEPLDDQAVRFRVTEPDGREVLLYAEPSLEEAGLYGAQHLSREPGGYRLHGGYAVAGDEEELTAVTGWAHDPVADLTAELKPDVGWLTELARGTGGRVLSLGELDGLPGWLGELDLPRSQRRVSPLWHQPWFFLMLLALLITEWVCRRRQGLV